MSELLDEEIIINQILESESNKETESDKYNKVDGLPSKFRHYPVKCVSKK